MRFALPKKRQNRRGNLESNGLVLCLHLPGTFILVHFQEPTLVKKSFGSVGVTSVGMFGKGSGWAIPFGLHTLDVALGGIAEKPGVIDGRIEIREYLCLTLSFDHDIIDGAPAARFTQRLKELIECGYGLEDLMMKG